MREIEFTIDPATGAMSSDFHGIVGADCDAVSALLEAEFGTAANVTIKPEDYYRVVNQGRQHVGPGRGPGPRK